VILSWTQESIINAGLAQIVVSIITIAAMIVLLRDGSLAVVAENREDADCGSSWHLDSIADTVLTIGRQAGKFCEPLIAGSRATGDGNIGV